MQGSESSVPPWLNAVAAAFFAEDPEETRTNVLALRAGAPANLCRFLLGIALLALPSVMRAQPAAYHRYRTLETAHFRVHTPPALEREGRVVAAAAERAYAQLSRELVPP